MEKKRVHFFQDSGGETGAKNAGPRGAGRGARALGACQRFNDKIERARGYAPGTLAMAHFRS